MGEGPSEEGTGGGEPEGGDRSSAHPGHTTDMTGSRGSAPEAAPSTGTATTADRGPLPAPGTAGQNRGGTGGGELKPDPAPTPTGICDGGGGGLLGGGNAKLDPDCCDRGPGAKRQRTA